jgi:hypothetical protein
MSSFFGPLRCGASERSRRSLLEFNDEVSNAELGSAWRGRSQVGRPTLKVVHSKRH